jgi:hypothetical protein
MDYISHSAVNSVPVESIHFSYDIACQWAKNLCKRREQFPHEIQLHPKTTSIRVCIPDMHVDEHCDSCRPIFAFIRRMLVGRTCGEGVETEWAVINHVAASSREMSPSARQEILCDHWGHWNWLKITKLGKFDTEHSV